MDVKSTLLNSDIEEEVYIEQPEGFQLIGDENQVCKLKKALYDLKQAPRDWYERLDKHIQQQGFKRESTDNNLYIKFEGGHFLIIVVDVDDIKALGEIGRRWATNLQKI